MVSLWDHVYLLCFQSVPTVLPARTETTDPVSSRDLREGGGRAGANRKRLIGGRLRSWRRFAMEGEMSDKRCELRRGGKRCEGRRLTFCDNGFCATHCTVPVHQERLVVAECHTCSYREGGEDRPMRLGIGRAGYHRDFGHDVREVS